MRTTIFWLCLTLLFGATQGPLLWLWAEHGSDTATLWGVFSHAPNQFIFLLIFFPVAMFVTGRLILVLYDLGGRHPTIRGAGMWRWGLGRGGIFWLAILVGAVLAIIDSLETPNDFYGKRPAVVREAADLNQQLAAANYFYEIQRGGFKEADQEAELAQKAKRLAALYAEPEQDTLLSRLEAFELAAALFVVVSLGGICLIALRLRVTLNNAARTAEGADLAEVTRCLRDLRGIAPLLVPTLLAFAAWCPLRAHNIVEIAAINPTYRTISPLFPLLIIVLAGIYALTIYYRDLRSMAEALKRIWGGLAALGGMTVVAWFTTAPTYLGAVLYRMTFGTLLVCAIAIFLLAFWLANLLQIKAEENDEEH